jgi:micrococcal nuclease
MIDVPMPNHVYPVSIDYCYDGDTCTLSDVDLGYDVHLAGVKIRLARIDAPEIRGSTQLDGLAARDCLRAMLKPPLVMQSLKRGKYGRWIAELWSGGRSINDQMVSAECAKYRDY